MIEEPAIDHSAIGEPLRIHPAHPHHWHHHAHHHAHHHWHHHRRHHQHLHYHHHTHPAAAPAPTPPPRPESASPTAEAPKPGTPDGKVDAAAPAQAAVGTAPSQGFDQHNTLHIGDSISDGLRNAAKGTLNDLIKDGIGGQDHQGNSYSGGRDLTVQSRSTAEVLASVKRHAAAIQELVKAEAAAGKSFSVAIAVSSNSGNVDGVQDLIHTLEGLGIQKSQIALVGTGDRDNTIAGLNPQLQAIAQAEGTGYTGPLNPSDKHDPNLLQYTSQSWNFGIHPTPAGYDRLLTTALPQALTGVAKTDEKPAAGTDVAAADAKKIAAAKKAAPGMNG